MKSFVARFGTSSRMYPLLTFSMSLPAVIMALCLRLLFFMPVLGVSAVDGVSTPRGAFREFMHESTVASSSNVRRSKISDGLLKALVRYRSLTRNGSRFDELSQMRSSFEQRLLNHKRSHRADELRMCIPEHARSRCKIDFGLLE